LREFVSNRKFTFFTSTRSDETHQRFVMSGMRSTQTLFGIQSDPVHLQLERASEIQKRFFPQRLTTIEGLDYYGTCHPAEQVGGDFFDFITTEHSVLTLSIGDVSGKGIPAALIMAGLQTSLRALTTGGRIPLGLVMTKLNRLLSGIAPANVFATMFLGQIDTARHELRYVSAGHEPAFIVRDKARILVPLESNGPALSFIRGAEYRELSIPLQAGDALVAATDGVSEAVETTELEPYEDLVARTFRRYPRACAEQLAEHIVRHVESLPRVPDDDDRTVVVVRSLMQEPPLAREHSSEAALVGGGANDVVVA
jgi:phosphoserine phosphatase RsbU/P